MYIRIFRCSDVRTELWGSRGASGIRELWRVFLFRVHQRWSGSGGRNANTWANRAVRNHGRRCRQPAGWTSTSPNGARTNSRCSGSTTSRSPTSASAPTAAVRHCDAYGRNRVPGWCCLASGYNTRYPDAIARSPTCSPGACHCHTVSSTRRSGQNRQNRYGRSIYA